MKRINHKIVFISLIAIFLYLNLNAAYAVTIWVPSEQPTIQAGIDAASDGDTVLIADGTYTGTGNKEIDFKGKAITVKSENGPTKSIIDCQGSGRGFYLHSDEGSHSVLSGFTIKNGFAEIGGGIYQVSWVDKMTISNCIITNNTAVKGGGIYSNNAIITNCIISNNTAGAGGGVYASTDRYNGAGIKFCTVTNNTGGGVYTYAIIGGVWGVTRPINSIIWGNSDYQIAGQTGELESGSDEDPIFVDPGNGNYHLSKNSPYIDAGTSDGAPNDDIDGDLRPQGLVYDIGADEYVSTDLVEAFVTRFYQQCLNRVPETAGLNGWVNALKHGTQSGANVANGFIFSQEFIDRNTLNEEFVVILYRAFFGREPDAGGYAGWVDALFRGKSRQEVLDGFIYSTEFENLCDRYGIKPYPEASSTDGDVEGFVTRYYQQCLGREPDAPGLEGWANALINGTLSGSDVANRFIFSQEFINRNTSNEEFVTILYRAFFDREPDSPGYNGHVNGLYNGVSRQAILNGFIYSIEFENLCNTYGIAPYFA